MATAPVRLICVAIPPSFFKHQPMRFTSALRIRHSAFDCALSPFALTRAFPGAWRALRSMAAEELALPLFHSSTTTSLEAFTTI